MSGRMLNIRSMWDNGAVEDWYSPAEKGAAERTEQFRDSTGAVKVVELRWQFGDSTVKCPFPATVLPDHSGVVLVDEWHFQGEPREGAAPWQRHLRVLNADGSLRLRVFPPVIDERSRPAESWVEEPRNFDWQGMPFGAPASDGYRDMVVDFDWQTGQVKRWIDATPWLRR